MSQIITLTGCGKTKADEPREARYLYTGHYTVKRRKVAERLSDSYWIASAEHGLLTPTEVVAPYDTNMGELTADERREWGQQVREQLQEIDALRDPTARVVVLLGRAYLEPIEELLQEAPAHYANPFEHTSGMDEQNGLLTRWLEFL